MNATTNHFADIDGVSDPNANWRDLNKEERQAVLAYCAEGFLSEDRSIHNTHAEVLSHVPTWQARHWVEGKSWNRKASKLLGKSHHKFSDWGWITIYKALALWKGGPNTLFDSTVISDRELA